LAALLAAQSLCGVARSFDRRGWLSRAHAKPNTGRKHDQRESRGDRQRSIIALDADLY